MRLPVDEVFSMINPTQDVHRGLLGLREGLDKERAEEMTTTLDVLRLVRKPSTSKSAPRRSSEEMQV